MSFTTSSKIDNNSIKYSNGLQSMEALIADMVSSINEPVRHKCKKIRQYMQAFLLDLIRSIATFEIFILPLKDLEAKLRIWEILQLKIPILSEINLKKVIQIQVFHNDDTTPILLV